MRTVRISQTALGQLDALLAQGVHRFGARVVAEKRDRVYDTLEHFLSVHPEAQTRHPKLGLRVYPVSQTPFVVLYDFDDDDLRVHFVLHRNADLSELDVAAVDW